MTPAELHSAVVALHAQIDAAVAPLAAEHRERLQCGLGCTRCCQDGIRVFPIEAELIRARHPKLLREATPHPAEGCAFLDDAGACRIYPERPYVCRTQGLPLRWIDEAPPGHGEGLVEYRDICPLNEPEGAAPLESLAPASCWSIGPYEERLARLQLAWDPRPDVERVPLRSLFSAPPPAR